MQTRPTFLFAFTRTGVLIVAMCVVLLASALNIEQLRARMQALGGSELVLEEWLKLVKQNQDTAIKTRLQKTNQFINSKISYAEDIEVWGQQDYWATPLESLAKQKGDCEDFVIAKYFTLRSLQIPDSQLRLIYVKAKIREGNVTTQQAHMVLAYYPESQTEPLILDNLIEEIRPASQRPDLTPIFSFNAAGVFTSNSIKATPQSGGANRLSRWQDLLERSRQEGF